MEVAETVLHEMVFGRIERGDADLGERRGRNIDKSRTGGIWIPSACGSVRFRRDDCFGKLWD
jgi:hypothetical protein